MPHDMKASDNCPFVLITGAGGNILMFGIAASACWGRTGVDVGRHLTRRLRCHSPSASNAR